MARLRSKSEVWWLPAIGLACGLVLVLSGSGVAQNITINNDLILGNIFPGIPKTVTKYTAGTAAEFYVTGTIGAEVSIDFTLPTYMNQSGSNMQMIFVETDCSMDSRNNPNQSNPQVDNLDPWHTLYDRLGAQGLTIWLGGTVVPKIYQPTGAYTASIVLTIAYTGN